MKSRGFTLLELTVTVAILAVISSMALVGFRTSVGSVDMSKAKETVVQQARDAMLAMTTELERTAKVGNPALTPPLNQILLVSATEIVFQVPVDDNGLIWSTPINYKFVSEDKPDANGKKNAKLDAGEDTNGNKRLDRSITRTQNNKTRIIASANDIASVNFALNARKDILTITLTATKMLNNGRGTLVTATLSSQVYFQN